LRQALPAVFALLILLMYSIPYTLLRDASPGLLYAYWLLVSLAAFAVALAELRRWR